MKTNFTAFISVSSYLWLDAGRFSNKFLSSVKGYSTVFISWVILGKWESVGRSVPFHDEKCLSETRGDRLAHCKLLRRLVICQTTSCKTRKSNRISQSGIFKSVPKCFFFSFPVFLFLIFLCANWKIIKINSDGLHEKFVSKVFLKSETKRGQYFFQLTRQ